MHGETGSDGDARPHTCHDASAGDLRALHSGAHTVVPLAALVPAR